MQWQGLQAANTAWEKLQDFKNLYPPYQLVDELFLQEGGNVVDAFYGKTYKRRSKQIRNAIQGNSPSAEQQEV